MSPNWRIAEWPKNAIQAEKLSLLHNGADVFVRLERLLDCFSCHGSRVTIQLKTFHFHKYNWTFGIVMFCPFWLVKIKLMKITPIIQKPLNASLGTEVKLHLARLEACSDKLELIEAGFESSTT